MGKKVEGTQFFMHAEHEVDFARLSELLRGSGGKTTGCDDNRVSILPSGAVNKLS